MTQQVIDVGVNADDGSGDSLYEAGNKINSNFEEFFDLTPVLSDLRFTGNNIKTKSTNADIDVHPSGTGSIAFPGIIFNDNNIQAARTNDNLSISASGSGRLVIEGLGFSGTSISAVDSSSVNINENLIVDGTMSATGTFAFGSSRTFVTGSTFGTLIMANGSITDSSGAISFGNENLTTTGTLAAGDDSVIGNLTLTDGSITDSSGAISFGNENLTTTGTLSAGSGTTLGNLTFADGSITDSSGAISFGNENLTTTGTSFAINSTLTVANGSITDSSGAISFGNENVTTTGTIARATGSTIGNLTLANGSITDSSGAISFGNENLTTTSTSMAINSTLTVANGSITDSTGAFTFVNENLTTTGTLTVDGASTLASMSVSGATSFGSAVTVDNLTFNDNIISTSSNADLNLTPGGTGVVNVANMTIDSSMNFTDNVIKVTNSNDDFVLSGNGTGSVVINSIDLNSGTIDNVVIGANQPAPGLFSPLNFTTLVIPTKLTFSGNTLKTSRSNDNLEFSANGSGKVIVNGLAIPNSDGQTGQFLQTDGSNTLSFVGTGIALEVSDIQDARNTIGFTSETVVDANIAVGENESIQTTVSMIDDFDQSQYDSAWYITLSRNELADSSIEFQMQKHIVAQGTEDGSTFDAFSGSSQIIRTSVSDEEVQLTSDVRAANSRVRLLGQGGLFADGSTISPINTLHFFRIGLGDNDSSGTQAGSGLQQTVVVADLNSAAAVLDSWAVADYRGAKYFISINNTTTNEVSSTEVMVVHDGTNAFITEYNTIISNSGNTPLATFTTDVDSGNVRLIGQNGTAGVCRVSMYRVLLSDNESTSDGTYVNVKGSTAIGQIFTTKIDHVTSLIGSRQGFEIEEVFDEFASSEYDSAWYLTLVKDMTSGRLSFHKFSILHGTSDDSSIEAFITDSGVVRNEEFDVVTPQVYVDDGNIQLRLTGTNDGSTVLSNFANAYRIGLGDNDSTGYAGVESGLATVEINTDVDSASESIDTFAHADHRGAKYFVSVMNATGGEVMNTELLVVHDGSAAYITSYNEHSSGNTGSASTNVLASFTAAISGSNVVVSAAGLQTNLRIHMYRILLADDQSATTSTSVNVISAVTVSSTATTIDTFSTNTHSAAHYIIIGSASDGKSIMEATVISDGTTASVSEGPQVSTKGTTQLELTASHSSTTTTLKASSTSGGSTTVNAYRIIIAKPAGTQYTQVDSFAHATTQGALYVAVTNQTSDSKAQIDEFMVVTDGTDAYNLRFGINSDSSSTELVEWTTVVDGSNVSVRAQLNNTRAEGTINAWLVHLDRAAGNPSNIATLDTWDKRVYRSAIYNVSISDANSGDNGLFEICDVRVTHDGTTAYLSVFARTNTHTSDLVTFTADVNGNNIRLRGTISSSNTHEVTVVRRVVEV